VTPCRATVLGDLTAKFVHRPVNQHFGEPVRTALLSTPGPVSTQGDLTTASGNPSLSGLEMTLLSGGRRTFSWSARHVCTLVLLDARATPVGIITPRGRTLETAAQAGRDRRPRGPRRSVSSHFVGLAR